MWHGIKALTLTAPGNRCPHCGGDHAVAGSAPGMVYCGGWRHFAQGEHMTRDDRTVLPLHIAAALQATAMP